MTKDWDRHKSEILTLYITKGKSLDDVRRILKGRHRFDASTRAYRMKLEEWGIRKNKGAATSSIGKKVRPRPSLTTTARSSSTLDPRSSNMGSEVLTDGNASSLTSEPMLQFQQHQTWPPGLHFSTTDSQNTTSSSLTVPQSFHVHLTAPYIDPSVGLNFATQGQNLNEFISHGTEEQITNLLSSGISVNTRDGLGNTPLHAAILRDNVDIVKSLLDYGVNVDAIGFKGKTPLHLAVSSKGMLKLLLKRQPTMSIQDDDGNTILHCMLSIKKWWTDTDYKTMMEAILSSNVDVNLTNKLGESPLHRLVADVIITSGVYMDVLSEFLNHEPDVTSPMRNGLSLLAVFLENSAILSKRKDGYSSVKTGYQCLEQFLIAGADPNMIYHSQPLIHHCVENGQFEENGPINQFWERLVRTANLEVVGSTGEYPLHVALSKRPGRHFWLASDVYKIVDLLLTRHANVNQANTAGIYPLELWLARSTYFLHSLMEIALLLIRSGARTMIFTSNGKTLFDLVARFSKGDQIVLTKDMLKGDIDSQQNDTDTIGRPEWAEIWRLAWGQRLWHLAKSHLIELEHHPSRPKIMGLNECAFLVLAQHFLEKHKCQLRLWQAGEMSKESVREDYEGYCAALRDCRDRNAKVDPSWYVYLLDLMEFN